MKRAGVLALVLVAALLAGDYAWRAGPPASQSHDWSAIRALVEQRGAKATYLEATWLALDTGSVDVVIVADGGRAPTGEERDALARFVAEGGRALVLGEPDAARALGVEILGAPISSATSIPSARPVLGVGETIATSGEGSYLDVDGDGRASPADAAGPFPIAIALHDGRAIVVGSASLESAPLLAAEILGRLDVAQSTVALDASRDTDDRMRDALLALGIDVAERSWLRIALGALLLMGAGVLSYANRAERRGPALDGPDTVVPLPRVRP